MILTKEFYSPTRFDFCESRIMIAKSTRVLFIVLITYARAHGSMNPYVQTAKEFNIHPPSLSYGYPVWNTLNLKPANGIIFLHEDMTVLEKINENTYVAKPTQENAEIIYHFTQNKNAHPLYHIVPDSNLTLFDLFQFIEWLTTPNLEVDFCLWSNEGKFTLVHAEDRIFEYKYQGCGISERLIIMNNCRNEFLIDGEFSIIEDIAAIVYNHYCANFLFDEKPQYWTRFKWSRSMTESKIDELETQNEEYDEKDSATLLFFETEINKYKRYFHFLEHHKELILLGHSAMINITLQCKNEHNIQTYYNILNEVNKGVYESRDWYSWQKFNRPYLSFLKPRWSNYLNYIHEQFPDIVCYHYYSEMPDVLTK